jgi:hypothetical protein
MISNHIRCLYYALFAVLLLCSHSVPALAQRAAGEDANIDPLFLIDTPVAGVLPATSGSIETFLYPQGGLLAGIVYGPFQNLNLGIYYGGTGIIGSGNVDWNEGPGFLVRYRFLEESEIYPAMIAGFDTQGRDGYIADSDMKQYVIKSPGFFVAASKNYLFYGNISFHGGMNYTLERHDGDKSPNVFWGFEKSIGSLISYLFEYNFAFDNDKDKKGFWNGNLSMGIRISTNMGFNFGLYFKNLLTSSFHYDKVVREIYIQYVRYI